MEKFQKEKQKNPLSVLKGVRTQFTVDVNSESQKSDPPNKSEHDSAVLRLIFVGSELHRSDSVCDNRGPNSQNRLPRTAFKLRRFPIKTRHNWKLGFLI